MILQSPAAEALVESLRCLPGIGKRTAERLALHLLSAPAEEANRLSDAIRHARERIRRCSICCTLTEADPCPICTDSKRDPGLICVVDHPSGVLAIERGGSFKGVYHVLHGSLNPLEGIGPSELTIDRLMQRLDGGTVTEVVLATNAAAEGEATAMYLSNRIREKGISVSRIAHGVPMGSGLEFADEATLAHALEGRTRLE